MIKTKYSFILTIFLITIFTYAVKAQIINTVAGGFNGDGYGPTSIGINAQSQVLDAAGNIYIAVPDKHIVMKLSKLGIYSTVAGNGTFGFSGDNGPATAAQLKNPWNIAVDAAGNLFIADNFDNRIRKVSASGIITTIAGNGKAGFSGDGGLATSAKISGTVGVVVAPGGTVYIADWVNRRVRKITTSGIISTFAGNGTSGTGGDGGPATAAQLGYVSAVALNSAGEVFIADNTNSKVRKVAVNGIITTVAGNGVQGYAGDGGLATAAKFNAMNGVTVDKSGNLFIADTYNNRVRKVDINGIVTTVAGNGTASYGGDGGLAKSAQLYRPTNVAIDSSGNILIATNNFRIRKVTVSDGIINTMAGNGSGGYCGDSGIISKAQFYHPLGVAADAAGNVFIVDGQNNRIRKVSSSGIITTIAGTGVSGFSGDGGPATAAKINYPTSIAVDAAGNIFFTDFSNNRIRKIASNGIITTLAGVTGTGGFNGDGVATTAKLWGPYGIAVDALGNVIFADQYNDRIRKITPLGTITTIAGSGAEGFSGDGGLAILASLNWPASVKVDKDGNVFVGDRRNNRIRKIAVITGIITTVAGNGTTTFSGDGQSALLAGLDAAGISVDASGNFYIADANHERIRKVNSAGIISTLAGGGLVYGDGGAPTAAQVHTTTAITSDPAGNIYITEYDNHRIRKITMSGGTVPRGFKTDVIAPLNEPSIVKFSIYPNPAQYVLNIQTGKTGSFANVQVIDVSGKVRLSQVVSSAQSVITFQIQNLTPGIYFIRATDRHNGTVIKQFLKQ